MSQKHDVISEETMQAAKYVAELKIAQTHALSLSQMFAHQDDINKIMKPYWDNEEFQVIVRDYIDILQNKKKEKSND